MAYRTARTWVLLVSVILAGIVVKAVLTTPNATGGGAAMMVLILLLAVIFKATIEFSLAKWDKRRDKNADSSKTKNR